MDVELYFRMGAAMGFLTGLILGLLIGLVAAGISWWRRVYMEKLERIAAGIGAEKKEETEDG